MARTLGSLAVGTKVKFGKHQVGSETPWDIVWTVVAKNHTSTPAYPSNSVTLHSTDSIDLRCFDAKEPDNTQNDIYAYAGNSRYSLSNIHQWLNSKAGAGAWYSAKHTYDQSPDASHVENGGAYADRPGFLNLFTTKEYDAILNTTVRTTKSASEGGSYEDITAKVFLASRTEVGGGSENGVAEGAAWAYYSDDASRVCNYRQEIYLNTTCTNLSLTGATNGWSWWLRTPKSGGGSAAYVSNTGAVSSTGYAYPRKSDHGIRPVINLSSSLLVSDTEETVGFHSCVSIIYNSAPSAPRAISYSGTPRAGKNYTITWGAATDPDGNLKDYRVQRIYNGEEYVTSWTSALSYTFAIEEGYDTVEIRVHARDSAGVYSTTYATTGVLEIDNNNAPTITSDVASNLGVKSDEFSITYSVTDSDKDSVTVVEQIDGSTVNTYTVSGGSKSSTMSISGETWLKLRNGSHTIKITATDSKEGVVTKSFTFTKSVAFLTIQNSAPYEADVKPTRIRLEISRSVAEGAIFKVEVCNNGFDSLPTWEDATSAVVGNRVYIFTNGIKSAAAWGVKVRVTIERGAANAVSFVSSIGGNFE